MRSSAAASSGALLEIQPVGIRPGWDPRRLKPCFYGALLACLGQEYSYLSCCGLSKFPRKPLGCEVLMQQL